MSDEQFEIVTGCLFIAVVEKENTNWILSDGREEGVDFQIWDRPTPLTMGGDEKDSGSSLYGALLRLAGQGRTYLANIASIYAFSSNIQSSFSGKSVAYAINHRYLINLGLPFLT